MIGWLLCLVGRHKWWPPLGFIRLHSAAGWPRGDVSGLPKARLPDYEGFVRCTDGVSG